MANYLLTGGAGFIGSHLAERLLADGHTVAALDDLSTGRIENIAHLLSSDRFHFARADIRDEIVLDRLASQCDVLVHLAAAVGVELIVREPVRTIETNILGTEAVLKTAVRYGCRTLIASTSEVYGKGLRIPFAEGDDVVLGTTTKSRWAYAASKMVDEFLSLAYNRQFGLPVVVFRLFNTVGPRQTGAYGMVVPRLMKQAILGEPLTVFGSGAQQRCFADVADAVEAICSLANSAEAVGRVFNVGNPNEEISMLELAQRVRQVAASSSEIQMVSYDDAYAPGFEDMERRVPDISEIKKIIGWTPRIGLDQTLARVRDWIRAAPEHH